MMLPRQPRGGADDDLIRPGSMAMLATAITLFVHSTVFLLVKFSDVRLLPFVSPAWESLLMLRISMGPLFLACYYGVYFALGERFWGLSLSVLLVNQYVLFQIAGRSAGYMDRLIVAVVLSSIAFLVHVSMILSP